MPETFRTAADKGFRALAVLYDVCRRDHAFSSDSWYAANALYPCLDYLLRTGQEDTGGLLLAGENHYRRLLQSSNEGRNDDPWWGNIFLQAWLNRTALGYQSHDYDGLFADLLAHSIACAANLHRTWSGLPYGQPADNAATTPGTITGGVYNLGQQKEDPLAGRNSMTNASFWLLCQALAEAAPGKGADPDLMATWYQQWLTPPTPTGRPVGLLDSRALVLERPFGQKDFPTWCWTGDQGLLYRALVNAGHPDTAQTIINAVFAHMTDDNCVLLEDSAPFPGRQLKYATGKGILLRNLRRPGDPPWQDLTATVIKANASAVWLNRLDRYGHQFGHIWSGPFVGEPLYSSGGVEPQSLADLVAQASGQDALNAALLIAPGEEIPGS